jgi:hypothetical protein
MGRFGLFHDFSSAVPLPLPALFGAEASCGPGEIGGIIRLEGKRTSADAQRRQVTYFKKWRVQDIKKKQMLKDLEAKGALKMDVQTEFKPQ